MMMVCNNFLYNNISFNFIIKIKAMLMNSVDNMGYNNGTLEKEFHYYTI